MSEKENGQKSKENMEKSKKVYALNLRSGKVEVFDDPWQALMSLGDGEEREVKKDG